MKKSVLSRLALPAALLAGAVTLAACGSSGPDFSTMSAQQILQLAAKNASNQSMYETTGSTSTFPNYSVSSWTSGEVQGSFTLATGGSVSIREVDSTLYVKLNQTALTGLLNGAKSLATSSGKLTSSQLATLDTQLTTIATNASGKWYKVPSAGALSTVLAALNSVPTKYLNVLANFSDSSFCKLACAVTKSGTGTVNSTSVQKILYQIPFVPATQFEIQSTGGNLPVKITVYSGPDPSTSHVVLSPTLSWPNQSAPSAPSTSVGSFCDLLTPSQYYITTYLNKAGLTPVCPAS